MLRIARYSSLTAATVAITAVVVWLTFSGNTGNVVFGDVIQELKEAKSVQLVQKQIFGKQPEISANWYIQGDQVRMEIPGQVVVVADLKTRQSVHLDDLNKTALRSTLPNDATKQSNNFLYQLHHLRPESAQRRSDEKLGGQTALVYEVDDLSKVNFLGLASAEGLMKIWVDPKSKLPVRIVVNINSNGEEIDPDQPFDTTLIFEEFKWNRKLDSSLFSMEIPSDYTILAGPPGPNP